MRTRAATTVEYGDFQTPIGLATEVCEKLRREGICPSAVVEPTCGIGNFLLAAESVFGVGAEYYGFEINPEYVAACNARFGNRCARRPIVRPEDFFQTDWKRFFDALSGEILVVGNPPWVTNSAIGSLGGRNLPKKENFQGLRGFESKTGKANFDISEWMLIRLIESLRGRQAYVAMLCKTATARKVLRHFWRADLLHLSSELHRIDAKAHFGASVEACLLVVRINVSHATRTAKVFPSLREDKPTSTFGLVRGELVADIGRYREVEAIDGIEYRKWWSGVKHDASDVMEFDITPAGLRNGLEQICAIEPEFVFPLLKSSDVANGRLDPRKKVLLTQRNISDDTAHIAAQAPMTWRYLLEHADALDNRRSVIYQKRARFSVFGVGEYAFHPWKVAVSGLYRNGLFSCIGLHEGKPIVVDDTCYFLPCDSEEEAAFFSRLLNSDLAQVFIASLSFPDNKRPINIDILRRIDLKQLAVQLNLERHRWSCFSMDVPVSGQQSVMVFEDSPRYGKVHSRDRKAAITIPGNSRKKPRKRHGQDY